MFLGTIWSQPCSQNVHFSAASSSGDLSYDISWWLASMDPKHLACLLPRNQIFSSWPTSVFWSNGRSSSCAFSGFDLAGTGLGYQNGLPILQVTLLQLGCCQNLKHFLGNPNLMWLSSETKCDWRSFTAVYSWHPLPMVKTMQCVPHFAWREFCIIFPLLVFQGSVL